MKSHYYNEFDPGAAAWIRELIADGLVPDGDVDERSIHDVTVDDVRGYVQCHFFAGIAGWPQALRLAGWPEDREVWTGSCPCQPFSEIGQHLGTKDPRHLWPVLRRLVGKCRPAIVFGEQVASKAGRLWLAGVRANMARLGYVFGASDLCSAGAGAPNLRQRLFWMGYSQQSRLERHAGNGHQSGQPGRNRTHTVGPVAPAGRYGFWSDCVWHKCQDGKTRRVSRQSEIWPMASRLPGHVGLLRGTGNAINPRIAAEFIQASLETITELKGYTTQ